MLHPTIMKGDSTNVQPYQVPLNMVPAECVRFPATQHSTSPVMVYVIVEHSFLCSDNGSLVVGYSHLFCWIEPFLIGYITPSTSIGSTGLVVI